MSCDMTVGRLFRGETTLDAFSGYLDELFNAADGKKCLSVFYAQHLLKEEGVYLGLSLPDDFRVGGWEQGRVFNSGYEVRWRVQEDKASLLLLTEQSTIPADCSTLSGCLKDTGAAYEVQEEGVAHLLVGVYYPQRGFFAQAGICREFRYLSGDELSLSNAGPVAAVCGKDYLRDGRVILTRFTRISLVREATR